LRRREAGEALPLPSDPAAALAIRQSLPDWLAAALLQWQTPEQAEAFARACNTPPALDLRVNGLRSTPEAVQAALAAAGVVAEPIEGLPMGLTIKGRSGDLRHLPGYDEGHWCVQDRSAQLVVPLLQPKPGDRILDACAAPGGKSTHLAELMGDQGLVLAVDRGEARLRRVDRNCERLGLTAIKTRCSDASQLLVQEPTWAQSFDRILVDAPCSGLGTLSRHPDARWRLGPSSIGELVEVQRQLLESLLPLLKPGGRLLYATCTVHPQENQQLVQVLLTSHAELELVRERQIWPGELSGAGDGFFTAVLRG
ncbi:MAG: 16S rRNA (cytosine(967)-C(5))-methyltransferase, partial [Synechococcaceae bacterium WB9_4xB_025]|nr:16S rRNA (cytosine(967)-C(5))-methyltransferase [Synechococcaceae bacterium WB9_4xB_025]